MSLRPLLHRAQGSSVDVAGDQSSIHVHRGTGPGMVGVEVRYRVNALVPVHVDRDSSKVANPRHAAILVAESGHPKLVYLEGR